MKWLIVLSVLLVLGTAEDKITKNDDMVIDIEAVMNDQDTREEYLNCLNGRGPCRDRTAFFKQLIAEALAQACTKCTPEQKHMFKRFLEIIMEKFPHGYIEFQQKYDPQNKYMTAFKAAIASA